LWIVHISSMTRSSAPLARFSDTTFDEISAVRKIFRIVSSTNLTRATQLDSVIHWSILFTLDAIKWRWLVDVQPSSVREILFALKAEDTDETDDTKMGLTTYFMSDKGLELT